jgi:hypothetical protein
MRVREYAPADYAPASGLSARCPGTARARARRSPVPILGPDLIDVRRIPQIAATAQALQEAATATGKEQGEAGA